MAFFSLLLTLSRCVFRLTEELFRSYEMPSIGYSIMMVIIAHYAKNYEVNYHANGTLCILILRVCIRVSWVHDRIGIRTDVALHSVMQMVVIWDGECIFPRPGWNVLLSLQDKVSWQRWGVWFSPSSLQAAAPLGHSVRTEMGEISRLVLGFSAVQIAPLTLLQKCLFLSFQVPSHFINTILFACIW